MNQSGGYLSARTSQTGTRSRIHASAPRSLLTLRAARSAPNIGTTVSSQSENSSATHLKNRLPCLGETLRRYAQTSFSSVTNSTVAFGSSTSSDALVGNPITPLHTRAPQQHGAMNAHNGRSRNWGIEDGRRVNDERPARAARIRITENEAGHGTLRPPGH